MGEQSQIVIFQILTSQASNVVRAVEHCDNLKTGSGRVCGQAEEERKEKNCRSDKTTQRGSSRVAAATRYCRNPVTEAEHAPSNM